MKLSKRVRVFVWFVEDLTKRYSRSLVFGFIVGLLVTIIAGRFLPIVMLPLTKKVERIGIIGEFTPSDLPLAIQKEISMGLTTLASNGTPEPGIAASWTQEDGGKTFVFTLATMTWHNGNRVQANDINYNITGVLWESIDEQTMKATLPEPYSPFPALVSKPLLQAGLTGVGPYKADRMKLKEGRVETLRLSPAQNTNLPIKEYFFYKTESLATLAYKRGSIDRVEDISSPESFANWRQTTIRAKVKYDRVVGLFFNMRSSIFQNRTLRQALAYGTPIFSDEERAHSPIQKTSWAYNDKTKHYEYDEEQAKKLAKSIPLPENNASITITTFPQYINQANTIAQSWTAIGIPTNVQVVNSLTDDFDVLLTAQDLPPDPDQYPFWHSKSPNNITGYTNLKVDKLLEDARIEVDQEKRKKLYADFQKAIAEDIPAIFLYHPKTYTIIRTSVLTQ